MVSPQLTLWAVWIQGQVARVPLPSLRTDISAIDPLSQVDKLRLRQNKSKIPGCIQPLGTLLA